MSVHKLYFLPCGRCLIDHSALNTTLPTGKMVSLPIWSYLLETSDGPILIDTGMPNRCAVDPKNYFEGTEDDGLIVPQMTTDDGILRVLARSGYQPRDLLCVINSHWHFDHAGGNGHFPDTPILVQRAEYEAAMTSEDYPPDCKLPNLNYQLLQGDYEVIPGVQLLYTPGHSPGHQSLLVHTVRSGPVLLTIDASYTWENFESDVPFACVDPALAATSLRRLRDVVREEHPQIFFGHDIEQSASWATFPDYL